VSAVGHRPGVGGRPSTGCRRSAIDRVSAVGHRPGVGGRPRRPGAKKSEPMGSSDRMSAGGAGYVVVPQSIMRCNRSRTPPKNVSECGSGCGRDFARLVFVGLDLGSSVPFGPDWSATNFRISSIFSTMARDFEMPNENVFSSRNPCVIQNNLCPLNSSIKCAIRFTPVGTGRTVRPSDRV